MVPNRAVNEAQKSDIKFFVRDFQLSLIFTIFHINNWIICILPFLWEKITSSALLSLTLIAD